MIVFQNRKKVSSTATAASSSPPPTRSKRQQLLLVGASALALLVAMALAELSCNVWRIGKKAETAAVTTTATLNRNLFDKLPPHDGTWKCCVDPSRVNPYQRRHPILQDTKHKYACPEHPSNFSWYFDDSAAEAGSMAFNMQLWRNVSVVIVGDSHSRQMYEQAVWEFGTGGAGVFDVSYVPAQYLFAEVGGSHCCNHDGSYIVDLRRLAPNLERVLRSKKPNYVLVSAGQWWDSTHAGHIIDTTGKQWHLEDKYLGGPLGGREWTIQQSNTSGPGEVDGNNAILPNLTFAHSMVRAIEMMRRIVAETSKQTQIVWRSDNHVDCPPGKSYRTRSLGHVLRRANVPVLNITRATCHYMAERQKKDGLEAEMHHSHLCFPSVVLRHWLLQFQRQFLETTKVGESS